MKLSAFAVYPAVALLAIGIAVRPTHAETVINFDDLPGGGSFVADGYGGLNWDNVGAFDTCAEFPVSGYCNGVTSPTNAAFNANGSLASFSTAGGAFTLNSFELTAAIQNETVTFTAYNLGVPIYQKTFNALESGPTLETLDWLDVDSVEFIGGTGGYGTQVVLDDITINGPVPPPVPEPSSMLLLGTGLMGLAGAARRKLMKA